MHALTLVLVMVLALAVPAFAAPGDTRLIQGTLEWPPSLAQTQLPVILVRGDDGALYYANITAAERRGAPTTGSQIAILGLEGKHSNEVVALLVTANNSPGRAPSVVATPAPVPAAPGRGASAPPGPAAPAPPLAVVAPPAPATPPTAAETSTKAVTSGGAAVVEAAPSTAAAADATRRWTEIQGVVQAVGRNTLVLKGDDGQRIVVDVSALGSGLAEGAAVGSVVKLYGVPTEQRFKASGFVESGSRRQ